jgi:uncharacterized Zn finger protein
MTLSDADRANYEIYGPCEECGGPREVVSEMPRHDGDEITYTLTMRCTRCGHSA